MRNGLIYLDTTAYLWFHQWQQIPLLTRLSRLVSRTGDGFLYAVLALLIYRFAEINAVLFVKAGLLAFLLELPAFMGLKVLIRRERPFVQLPECSFAIQPSDKFSMPSGHTAAAFLMAGLISYCFPEFTLLAYFWALLIGMSRVALGVHYPGDILAGAVLGLCCSFISLSLLV